MDAIDPVDHMNDPRPVSAPAKFYEFNPCEVKNFRERFFSIFFWRTGNYKSHRFRVREVLGIYSGKIDGKPLTEGEAKELWQQLDRLVDAKRAIRRTAAERKFRQKRSGIERALKVFGLS